MVPQRGDPRLDILLHCARNVGVVLVVDSRDLLISFGDDAHLFDGGPTGVHDEAIGADAGRGQLVREPIRSHIASDDADQ